LKTILQSGINYSSATIGDVFIALTKSPSYPIYFGEELFRFSAFSPHTTVPNKASYLYNQSNRKTTMPTTKNQDSSVGKNPRFVIYGSQVRASLPVVFFGIGF